MAETQLWNSRTLADHEFPEPSYLVDRMIPQGGTFLLHGKPGVGKTQLMLSLCQAINSGDLWLDRWQCRQGSVVFVQADMTSQIQQERIIKVVQHVDIDDTYWLVEPDGSMPSVNIESMTILMSEIVDMIQEIDPAAMIWDTLRKIHRLPENVSESPVIVYDAARRVCKQATHIFNHHDRKSPRDPDAVDLAEEDFMGNIQWWGAADATATLAEIDTPPKRVRLKFNKARTTQDEDKEPIILEIDNHTINMVPIS